MDSLLRLLEENSLATHETLAAQLDTTPAEIKKRIKQLEHDRVILAYKAIVDDERAKRTHVKAVIEVRITPEREGGFDRIAHRIAQYREVQSCFLMSGGFDLLVFIEGDTLQEVAAFVSEKLSTLPGIRLLGPAPSQQERGGLVSFAFADVHAHDIVTFADEDGIALRGGHHCNQPLMKKLGLPSTVRASFYVYNTRDEVDRLVVSLRRIVKFFGGA